MKLKNLTTMQKIEYLFSDDTADLILLNKERFISKIDGFVIPITHMVIQLFKSNQLDRSFVFNSDKLSEEHPMLAIAINKKKNIYLVVEDELKKDSFTIEVGKNTDDKYALLIYVQTNRSAQLISALGGNEHIEILDSYDFFTVAPYTTQKILEMLLNPSCTPKEDDESEERGN